jgi:hypothetical protein
MKWESKAAWFCMTVMVLCANGADAELRLPNDPRNGALDAVEILIVRKQADDWRVVETLLGKRDVDSVLKLTDLKVDRSDRLEPERPVTARTRVLVLLGPERNDEGDLRVSFHSSCFARVEDPADITSLRQTARDVLQLRSDWNRARGQKQREHRVVALWPFLWNGGMVIPRRTAEELKKLTPVSGNYIVDQFDELSHRQRMTLLSDANEYGGQKLHQRLKKYLKTLRADYDAMLEQSGPDVATEDWSNLPQSVQNLRGELYYGLHGLAAFRDQDDLPFIRDMASWALKRRLKQTCDAALSGFKFMPARANLPLIAGIWSEFSERPYEGNDINAFDVTRSLRVHKFSDTVPILAKLIRHKDAGTEAHAFLTEIVGRDLGADPQAWISWHAAQNR